MSDERQPYETYDPASGTYVHLTGWQGPAADAEEGDPEDTFTLDDLYDECGGG